MYLIIREEVNQIENTKMKYLKLKTPKNVRLIESLPIIFLFLSFLPKNISAECVFQNEIETKELEIGNLITWVTTSEKDNAKFIIQKSFDGNSFSEMGILKGAGNSVENKKYRFLDTKIGEKKVFYRIVYVDFNDKEYATPTIIVNRKNANNFVVTGMSTTITAEDFSLALRSSVSGQMTVKIKSDSGEKTFDWEVVEGANMFLIDLKDVELGTHEIELSINEEIERLTIQKVSAENAPIISYSVRE